MDEGLTADEQVKLILDQFERAAVDFASTVDGQVTRDLWDAPVVDVRWCSDDGIWRSIRMFLVDAYQVGLMGAAWQDEVASGVRRWRTEVLTQVPAEKWADELLFELADQLNDWTVGDLTRSDPLPKRPAGWR